MHVFSIPGNGIIKKIIALPQTWWILFWIFSWEMGKRLSIEVQAQGEVKNSDLPFIWGKWTYLWKTNTIKFLPNISQWGLVCPPTNAKETWWLPDRAMIEICWKACWSFLNTCVTFWWPFSQTLKYHSYICDWLQDISVIIKLNGIWGLAIAEACYYKVVTYSLGLLTVNHTPGTSSLSRVEYVTIYIHQNKR